MPNVLNNKGAFWCHKHNCAFTGFQFDLYCGKCVMAQEALAKKKDSDYFDSIGSAFDPNVGRISYKSKYSNTATILKFGGSNINGGPGGGFISYYADHPTDGPIEIQIPHAINKGPAAAHWAIGDILEFEEEWVRRQGTYPVYRVKSFNHIKKTP